MPASDDGTVCGRATKASSTGRDDESVSLIASPMTGKDDESRPTPCRGRSPASMLRHRIQLGQPATAKVAANLVRLLSYNDKYPVTMGEVLVIDVEPGWKKATRITFPGKGHHEPGLLPGDIVFVIGEKAHAVFWRNGNDLIVHQWNSLLEARTGKTLVLTTLKQKWDVFHVLLISGQIRIIIVTFM
ncbi:hypothetical protein Dimus_031583 [Dionaea muscipula]